MKLRRTKKLCHFLGHPVGYLSSVHVSSSKRSINSSILYYVLRMNYEDSVYV